MLQLEAVNYACNFMLFRIIPAYVLGYMSLPLWLGYNFCLTQSTGCQLTKSTDNQLQRANDSNLKFMKYIFAAVSTNYCCSAFLMVDLSADRFSLPFLTAKIIATVVETGFYFKSMGFVTQLYRYSVLLAIIIRVVELATLLALAQA